MDSDDKIITEAFMDEEVNDTVDEEEHLTILACLLQPQADEVNNAIPEHECSKLGK